VFRVQGESDSRKALSNLYKMKVIRMHGTVCGPLRSLPADTGDWGKSQMFPDFSTRGESATIFDHDRGTEYISRP